MSVKAERGTKRTCQNNSCGARFYDLNRDPATCPICGTVYELAVASPTAMAAASAPVAKAADPRKAVKKPVFAEDKPDDAPEADGEEALVALEDEEATAGGDEDETFLEEEEEDGSDMSNIIGGPVTEGEEPV
ncbi:MAG: TIGR02300 family protein [Hyphomicrobiales bacterium]|nr:MAG: TIGR02300 family protein [Hyphomicrobiales bacterium]